jgi:hypothetical protein
MTTSDDNDITDRTSARKDKVKTNYDRTAQPLSQLEKGDEVLVQNRTNPKNGLSVAES